MICKRNISNQSNNSKIHFRSKMKKYYVSNIKKIYVPTEDLALQYRKARASFKFQLNRKFVLEAWALQEKDFIPCIVCIIFYQKRQPHT